MRRHILVLRFGEQIFLDAQKRQFNSFRWPYIGPVVLDNEKKIRPIIESLVIQESTEFYIWILQQIQVMEGRFSLSNVKMIFGDKLVSPEILKGLGIDNTCLLHGDYYHLMNEVFPNQFTTRYFNSIKGFLENLLIGNENEWKESIVEIKKILSNDAANYCKITEIEENPSYFSMWFTRKNIYCNLNIKGSTFAEINHSSNVAHLGKGGTLEPSEHIQQLLDKNMHLSKVRHQEFNKYSVSVENFRSKCRDSGDYDSEMNAKRCLSKYAFNELFTKEFKMYKRLLIMNNKDDETAKDVQDKRTGKIYTISSTKKCTCYTSFTWGAQCRHHMKYFGGFDPDSYHHRWYNDSYYDQNVSIGNTPDNANYSHVTTVNNNQAMFIPTQTQNDNAGIDLDEDYQDNNDDNNNNDDDDDDDDDDDMLGNDYQTNYNELVNKAKILIEAAGADNNKKDLCSTILI